MGSGPGVLAVTAIFEPFLIGTMSWLSSTRDMAVQTAAELKRHMDECGRNYVESRDAMEKLADELDAKHKDNIERFEKFQQKLYIIALILLAGLAVKGTPLDIIAKVLAGV